MPTLRMVIEHDIEQEEIEQKGLEQVKRELSMFYMENPTALEGWELVDE